MLSRVSARRAWSRSLATAATAAQIDHRDIVVVGGGPAGLALVAALASTESVSSTHKITLLEGSPLDRVANWNPPAGQFSNRVSSITADNVEFLSSIGAWQHVDLTRTRAIEEMQVWDGISGARIEFTSPSERQGIKPMATLVENLNLQRGLLSYLRANGKVEILDDSKVMGIQEGEGGWPLVQVDRIGGPSRTLRPRLLIGADGFKSPVKSYSEIETFGWAYNAHGLVASIDVAAANGGEGMTTAWQRFLPQGPVAFLPMSDTTASLVWSTSPSIASAVKLLPPALLPPLINHIFSLPYSTLSPFLSLLTSSPSPSTPDLEIALDALSSQHQTFSISTIPDPLPPTVVSVQSGSLASFPLRLSHAQTYLGMPKDGRNRRTVLVGDAAHTVHPMAGQGLNMGLGDVRALVDTLDTTAKEGGDIGSFTSLKPYPRARYLSNHAVLSTTDHLSTLYSSQLSPVIWARSTGLEILNELPFVKELIMGGAGAGNTRNGGNGAGTVWGSVGDVLGKGKMVMGVAEGLAGMLVAGLKERVASGLRGSRE